MLPVVRCVVRKSTCYRGRAVTFRPLSAALPPGNPFDSGSGSEDAIPDLVSPRRRGYDGSSYVASSCPSQEHASFAFARLAASAHSSGSSSSDIGKDEFISSLIGIGLDYGLGKIELGRVFDRLDLDGDGRLIPEEFRTGSATSPMVMALINELSGRSGEAGGGAMFADSSSSSSSPCYPDPDFDPSLSTAENYRSSLSSGFVGENAAIRSSLDYEFHRHNYDPRRQIFQDSLIRRNVLLDAPPPSKGSRPWLVYTCGPMGAGKGWVLGWMSANGILPLEKMAKIDPDAFKLRMPEWQIYQRSGLEEQAGTLTHAESSYVAEIAHRKAMSNGMSVWVDGSLRNYEWYRDVELPRVRNTFPQYRIAMIAVDAPEYVIEDNLRRRERETGRVVPDELRRASAVGLERGLRELVHLVDVVCHVRNESDGNGDDGGSWRRASSPKLLSIAVVDRSGDWNRIKFLADSPGRQDVPPVWPTS